MTDEPHIGQELRRRGWRQGVVFTGTGLAVVAHERKASGEFHLGVRQVKAQESLILVSQDCDIVARREQEPRLEALVCKRGNERLCWTADRNSARFFLVDPATGLVAQAAYKVIVTKEAVLDGAPQPWPSDEVRRQRFVRWLARRYDRFPLPDQLDDAFRKPLDLVLDTLHDQDPLLAAALSSACHEWRINMPTHEEAPFTIHLSLLLNPTGLTATADDAIDVVIERLRETLDPALVTLDADVRKLTDDQMSLTEFYATVPLFLEPLTYEGDEIVGAPPLPRA